MTDLPTVQLSRIGVAGGSGEGAETIEVPKSLGPVRLVRQLGAGAMGVVWLGHHEVLARDVAVKFLLAPGAAPGQGAEFDAFIEGARAAAAVRHSGMTAVHDAGSAGGVAYLVMEYVEGPTLGDLLRKGALPLGVVRRVLSELCGAVAELHEHDLVHRDIKPANVMVSSEGAAVLTDFGLACPAGALGRPIAGTVAYMAPEMFLGDVSAKSDVYAMGVMAFELLTGRVPYQGNVEEVRAEAGAGVVPRGVMEERRVPEGVIDAVERAMNKDGMFRPKSVRRLMELFEKGFEKAGVGEATGGDVQALAFPDGGQKAEAGPAKKPSTIAGTMFDLVSERAKEKRRSAPSLPVEEVVAAPVAPVTEVSADEPVSADVNVTAPVAGSGVARASAVTGPLDPRLKRFRVYKAVPVAWGRLAMAALVGVAIVAVVGGVLELVFPLDKTAHTLGGMLRTVAKNGNIKKSNGQPLDGDPSDWIASMLGVVYAIVPMLVAVLPMLMVYHRAAFTRGWPGGWCEPVCGWCGMGVRGAKDGRCAGCGRRVGDAGSSDDSPPAKQLSTRLLRYAAGSLTFVIGATILTIVVAASAGRGTDRTTHILLGVIVALVCAAPAILMYHWVARKSAMLTGVVRCGRCGAAAGAEGAGCVVCAARERRAGVRE